MKYLRLTIISCCMVLFVAHFSAAASILKATIPNDAPFKNGEISWNFGQVAQGVTPSSFFDLKNTSLTPVGFNITAVKDFTFTPNAGPLLPNKSVRITLRINPTAISGSQAGGQFTINATRGDPIINWTVVARIVDAKPDLSAAVTLRPPIAAQGGATVPLSIAVSNAINLVNSQPCEVKVFLDNAPIKTLPLGIVSAGATKLLDGTFQTNKHGVHAVRVVVDSNNQNNELNETNNEPPPQNVTLP